MSDRPVYIPSRKRNKKQFFHGAFTGGFSSGYFNTVGSKEGWAPQQQQDDNDARREQKPEDFMDEEDHNAWGGPTSVREEYAASSTLAPAAVRNDRMLDLVKPPAQNVGHRLLRILGWRDGSTAYVPHEDATAALLKPGEQSVESLLSSRRLKKIQLQQSRVQIPPPKLDTGGLGYEPYQNAPEFRAHRERRRKEAQERAKAVTASSAANRNVYRLSNLLDNDDQDDETHKLQKNAHEEEDNPLVSYETEQSFVGTKTVGGFALREDDDDVYDDNVVNKASKINTDEYDTVVYEHASDVEDEDTKGATATGEEFGSVFASWATSKAGGEVKPTRGITSDGRPPLPGFVLGASSTPKMQKRYPGPDIPSGYEPKRHEFGNDERPGAFKDESHTAQQELMEQRRKKVQAERKAEIIKKEKERESGPMAGSAFVGLAAAMKNRFTSSAPDASKKETTATGLQHPKANGVPLPPPPATVKDTAPKPITMRRTTMMFVPESLLCKRFHVAAPAHAKPTLGTKKAAETTGEAAYFAKEILSKATTSGVESTSKKKKKAEEKDKSLALREQLFGKDDGVDEDVGASRPSMKVLESIFEPQSESSESEEELDDDNKDARTESQDQVTGSSVQATAAPPPEIPDGVLRPAESSVVVRTDKDDEPNEGESSRKHRRRRSRDDDERKRRKRRSRSRSPSNSSDRSRRKRSRKREEKKKRKKRHKSSRRQSKDD